MSKTRRGQLKINYDDMTFAEVVDGLNQRDRQPGAHV